MTKRPNQTDVIVGTRARLRRKELGLSQGNVADKLGITFQQIQKYENGTNRIGAGRLLALADALGVPINYFFPESGQEGSESEISERFDLLGSPGVELLRDFAQITDRRTQKALALLTSILARAGGLGSATAKLAELPARLDVALKAGE